MSVDLIGKLRKAFVGTQGLMDANDLEVSNTNLAGVLSGVTDGQTALARLDATGVGADLFSFTGAYSATNANIAQWFGNKQLVRMRCTGRGSSPAGSLNFDLPGSTALNAAFDILQGLGLEERLQFNIEYTGDSSSFVNIRPRISPSPQIMGTTNILVRSGVVAVLEITRTSGTISDYVFLSISPIASQGQSTFDNIKLQNPANVVWDASASGTLPSTGVVKGNAYKVVNAPTDGSGRFNEPMVNDDWVVWDGETFTSWSAEPHQWFVIAAHDVRRITALQQDYLTDIEETPVSNRNATVRGAEYADSVAEIRLKIYATAADYSAADLNTTGDIDEYTNTADITGKLAIRLAGTQATLSSMLPNLFVYSEDASGNFVRLFNLDRDFAHQGDFGGESDYLTLDNIDYEVGQTLRIYVVQTLSRYNNPALDVFESNLSAQLQAKINRHEAWASIAEVLFSGARVLDQHADDRVEYAQGYSRGIDWRDMAQTTTINDSRYKDDDLVITADHASFEISGFGPGFTKLMGIGLQRNDLNNNEGAMVEIAPGIALIRVTTSNTIQVNTRPNLGQGNEVWQTLTSADGTVALSNLGNNFLIFEIDPDNATLIELIAGFFDGTNYYECNNVYIHVNDTITGDHLGFSRSLLQRGQITRFSAINSGGYLLHSELDSLLRQHTQDKWNFGYARLYEGSDKKVVVFDTNIEIGNDLIKSSPDGTRYKVEVSDAGDVEANTV